MTSETETEKKSVNSAPLSSCFFIRFGTAQRNLEAASEAIKHHRAVLLQGSVGSGKSTCAEILAAQNDRAPLVSIAVDDTIDARDLIGKCQAGERPGTFRWCPGPLLTAAAAGRWVLMEDIDLASFDIFAALRPLLEGDFSSTQEASAEPQSFVIEGTMQGADCTEAPEKSSEPHLGALYIADWNTYIKPHPNFRLIATQQLGSILQPASSTQTSKHTATQEKKLFDASSFSVGRTITVAVRQNLSKNSEATEVT